MAKEMKTGEKKANKARLNPIIIHEYINFALYQKRMYAHDIRAGNQYYTLLKDIPYEFSF